MSSSYSAIKRLLLNSTLTNNQPVTKECNYFKLLQIRSDRNGPESMLTGVANNQNKEPPKKIIVRGECFVTLYM